MKRIAILFFLFFILSHLYSCGPSAAEQAQIQQRHDDSIKNATENKFELQKEITDAGNASVLLRNRFENVKATLDAETDQMNHIKEFHLGRTTEDREQQIKDQSLKIQHLQDELTTINQNITNTQDKITSLKLELQKYQ